VAAVITVNPYNPNEVWLGTANGGVWHSTDGACHWLFISDREESLAIGAIAVDDCSPVGCAVVYAGTGENKIRRDTYYGRGLLIGRISSDDEFFEFRWKLQGKTCFNFGCFTRATSG
jgi:hypothetical protein